MMDSLLTEDQVREHLDRQTRLDAERGVYESDFRDVDHYCDPQSEDGFYLPTSKGGQRGRDTFDDTAAEGLDRYTAAILGLTVPRNSRWHTLTTPDKDLNRVSAVQLWCEHAADRLFACRYAPSAGFEMQAAQDIRQGGKYGYAGLWVDEIVGRGLFYKAIPGRELYIDEDFRGRVDTKHRKFELSVRQIRQKYGEAALTDKMAQCWDNPNRREECFELLHIVYPNGDRVPGDPTMAGKPLLSAHIAIDEKCAIRVGGYNSDPIPVSRTALGSKYGRAPARKVLGTIFTAQEIAKTLLRSGHKAVDPALAFFDDGVISKLVTKPGGLNPGLVDEFGRMLVAPIPGGGNFTVGQAMQESERAVIKSAFLEELFQILTDPADRMTATQVLEMVQKQGVLVGPFAGQHETEKLGPMIERELDVLMRAGQIAPMPPEMVEARLRPVAIYQNPLAMMSRAEEAAGFTRWVEIAAQIAGFDPSVFDLVNTDRSMQGVAEVLSVRPSWLNSPDEVAAKRAARQQQQEAQQFAEGMPGFSTAALNLAKANQAAQAA